MMLPLLGKEKKINFTDPKLSINGYPLYRTPLEAEANPS